MAEDALFACSAAVLSGYLWSDYGSFEGKLGDALRRLDLGKRLTGLSGVGSVDFSFFQNGLVAVNGGSRKRVASIPVPKAFGHARLRNLIDGGKVACEGGALRIVTPANSGRILLAE